ncbi:hypothetical protein MES4922_40178 [Mesorhizobium ventifaucium]|uniref:Uncharacterized protein n=1 Tax=Mesorhizobium ventifaucium TaxID=666020 RepID=A0ABM9E835_9HYPH|nr:hypothetical protein MES4922_40178 [Mesorhizobium ventifaucium]
MDLRRGDAVLPGKMRYHISLAAGDPIPVAWVELRRVGCHAYSPLSRLLTMSDWPTQNGQFRCHMRHQSALRRRPERTARQSDRRTPVG